MDHGRDGGGQRIRKWKSFAKKREAEAFQIQSASHPAFGAGQGPYGSTQLRLGAFLQQWLSDHARVRVQPSTFRRYGEFVNLHITPGLGHVQLTRLSPQVIEGFYRKLLGKISPTTSRHVAVLLLQSLDTAVRWGLILQNPADKVEKPKPSRWAPALWNAEQAVRFLEGARGRKHYLLYALLLTTGLRLGEALALTWADIDFAHGVLLVRQGKTPNARRGLRLADELVKELRAVRGVGLIFRSRTGGPLDPATIRNDHFYPLLEKLEIPRIRLHDLRHMHGSFLLQDGVDLATVSARLGHASKAFTMQQYIHALTTGQERAAESSNQLLTQARAFAALAAGQEHSQDPHK
jgi:integrase